MHLIVRFLKHRIDWFNVEYHLPPGNTTLCDIYLPFAQVNLAYKRCVYTTCDLCISVYHSSLSSLLTGDVKNCRKVRNQNKSVWQEADVCNSS